MVFVFFGVWFRTNLSYHTTTNRGKREENDQRCFDTCIVTFDTFSRGWIHEFKRILHWSTGIEVCTYEIKIGCFYSTNPACQTQSGTTSRLGRWRGCVPSPPSSSTSLAPPPATSSLPPLLLLDLRSLVCPRGSVFDIWQPTLQDDVLGKILPKTFHPPPSSCGLFCLSWLQPPWPCMWRESPTRHECLRRLHQSFQRQFLSPRLALKWAFVGYYQFKDVDQSSRYSFCINLQVKGLCNMGL